MTRQWDIVDEIAEPQTALARPRTIKSSPALGVLVRVVLASSVTVSGLLYCTAVHGTSEPVAIVQTLKQPDLKRQSSSEIKGRTAAELADSLRAVFRPIEDDEPESQYSFG